MAEGKKKTPEVEPRFKGVPPKIADEIMAYENQYFKEDLPIPFCGTLKLYPATVREYEVFSHCSSCLTLNKNQDAEGLRMSYLDYLYSRTQLPGEEGQRWSYKIQKLFEVIFHIQNGIKCTKCGRVISYNSPEFIEYINKVSEAQKNNQPTPDLNCPTEGCGSVEFIEMMKFVEDPETHKHDLYVDGQKISRKDFDRLRYIVLFQNFPDYQDDSWVDPDIKKDYEERQELERKKNDVYATIEKKIVCLSIYTSWTFEYIYSMSIRKFTMALVAMDDLINYKINRTAMMSGFVQWPKDKPLEHWIYKPHKDLFGDNYKSIDEATKGL